MKTGHQEEDFLMTRPLSGWDSSRGLLHQLGHVGGRVVGLHHVDREAVILAGVAQSVCQVALGLAVALDVLDVQVQDLVIVLQLGQIGGVQEVVGGIEDVQPDILRRRVRLAQLVAESGVGAVASRNAS